MVNPSGSVKTGCTDPIPMAYFIFPDGSVIGMGDDRTV